MNISVAWETGWGTDTKKHIANTDHSFHSQDYEAQQPKPGF